MFGYLFFCILPSIEKESTLFDKTQQHRCLYFYINYFYFVYEIFLFVIDSNCSTGPIAIVCPSREGWLQMDNIVFPLSMAVGILESRVAEILAAHPPSWI